MGYSISNIQSNEGVQTIFESSGEHVSGNFKSPKGDQFTSNVVQTLIHQGSVINVTTDNDVVSVIINKHDHTSLRGQPVIQNDLWAHPTALNKIVARAVAGDENNIQYYHKNYLDHVYAVSDKDGDIKEHYRYTAFGEVEIYNTLGQKLAESAIDNDVLWNSRRFDGDTGLYYYLFRHYKADIGRWLGRDPIEEDGGINLYAFVGNDVVDSWDRLGLCKKCEDGEKSYIIEDLEDIEVSIYLNGNAEIAKWEMDDIHDLADLTNDDFYSGDDLDEKVEVPILKNLNVTKALATLVKAYLLLTDGSVFRGFETRVDLTYEYKCYKCEDGKLVAESVFNKDAFIEDVVLFNNVVISNGFTLKNSAKLKQFLTNATDAKTQDAAGKIKAKLESNVKKACGIK